MGVEGPHSIQQEIELMFGRELALKERAWANYTALDNVLVREMKLGGVPVEFHFNPGRVASVMAKVDPETLRNRRCFLCPDGLGPEQLTTEWVSSSGGRYCLRVNPFPIFDRHYTISAAEHVRQEITGRYADMLSFCALLPDYVIFYNGPKCGASAPDHFHFQAFPKGRLPLEHIVRDGSYDPVVSNGWLEIGEIKSYVRGGYLLRCASEHRLRDAFDYLVSIAKRHGDDEWEPRMNIVSWCEGSIFSSVVFFREESRPQCFWGGKDGRRIYISPASVEMSGVIMTSSEETFRTLTESELAGIMLEVSLEEECCKKITNLLKEKYE